MKNLFQQSDYIYFIGIGGISMSGLAEILSRHGYRVAGTDIKSSPATERLKSLGIPVNIGHRAENITDDVTHVVFTAAVHEDNPELQAARGKGLVVLNRAELLGKIMREHGGSAAISGTHGKTTTTSMLSEILLAAEADPTITVGGILPSINGNLRIGASPYFVAEACEYYNSFLELTPLVGVILNIEKDHLDFFGSLENIYRSFRKFADGIPKRGTLIINSDIKKYNEVTEGIGCNVETFSLTDKNAHWQAENILHHSNGTTEFDVIYKEKKVTSVTLGIPGEHNISNALAAMGAANALGIAPDMWVKGLRHFKGTERRFQHKGVKNGVQVVDDYAHHPTEIRATLKAAKNVKHATLWCVFQPHTYSRTKFLFDEFGEAFYNADEIIIADIYAAREKDDGTISARILAERIASTGKNARYVGDFDDILKYLKEHCTAGDMLLTVGAGDVYKIGERFLEEEL